VKLSFEVKYGFEGCKHYSCSGLFDEPVLMKFALVLTGTTGTFRNLSYITSLHRYVSLAVELSFEAKSGFESTKVAAALVFLLDL
jgi:hypothetical protein